MEQSKMELQNTVNSLRETHNIEEQEWTEVESTLKETLEGEELTPEKISDAVLLKRDFEVAEKVTESYQGQFVNDEQESKFLDSLVDVKQQYPHFTEEDLKEVADAAMRQIKQDSAKEKLEKKVASKKKIQSKKQPKQTSQSQGDGIDPELEDWL
jgi:uncharacterized protein with PIN domain